MSRVARILLLSPQYAARLRARLVPDAIQSRLSSILSTIRMDGIRADGEVEQTG
jgi:hypothetical protein